METASLPSNEAVRLHKLHELEILDTLEEQAYDDLTSLAARICNTPIALISLIDKDRQWFKSHYGLEARETPRDYAFCAHAILNDTVFVVESSGKDNRFHDNPLATGEPHVEFYAGAPLIMGDNIRVGTLCVIDHEERTISNEQKTALEALARQVVSQLELRIKIKELILLDQAKDEFIALVSHELRTPLTSIFGSLSLLLNKVTGELADQQKQLIDVSFRNTERLLHLVNDILDLAKLESGKIDLKLEKIDVLSLAKKAIELNQHYSHTCETELKLECDDSLQLSVMGDEPRLLQVLSNFISNAAKFTHKGDCIEVSVSAENGSVFIGVTDHGSGIPPEQQSLLFKKFQQLHQKSHNKLPGTGLGLNICKNIIEQHKGSIGLESKENARTTFYFKLPVV